MLKLLLILLTVVVKAPAVAKATADIAVVVKAPAVAKATAYVAVVVKAPAVVVEAPAEDGRSWCWGRVLGAPCEA